jgi:hypothetical protein
MCALPTRMVIADAKNCSNQTLANRLFDDAKLPYATAVCRSQRH